ncbi:MAG: dipeptidase [Cellulosilyticaceae bacterium]
MPIIDLHCDTASLIYENHAELKQNPYHVDLAKLKQGQYKAQWFAYFIQMENVKGSLMEELRQMDAYFKNQIQINNDQIEIVCSKEDYLKCQKEHKIAAFLSLEEGQTIEHDLDNLRALEQMGIRMMNVTWNYPNDLGYPHHMREGLTPFGKEVVSALNTSPILLDVSHLSFEGMRDIMTIHKKPVIASHCNAFDRWPHSRNLRREAVRWIAERGGIIGLNFYNAFLGSSTMSRMDDMMAHIDYLYQVGGSDVLALGTDFDGINCDLEVCNAGELDKLITKLSCVYSDDIIDKFCYSNAERIILENL